MLASIGLLREVLEDICHKVQNAGIGFVACANYNTHEQIVLSGENAALEACVAEIKKAGGKAMPLKVSGPFHTKLMEGAAQHFASELTQITPKEAALPIISNVDGGLFNLNNYVETLTKHMTSPVLWTQCVEKAISMGADTFVELGGGRTLVKFVKKINGCMKAFAAQSIRDMEEIL